MQRPRQAAARSVIVQATAEVSLDLERAFAALSLEQMSRWWKGFRLLDGSGDSQHAALRLALPWRANAWVKRLEPPHRLELLIFPEVIGVREELECRLEGTLGDGGRSRITLESRSSGFWAPLWALWRRRNLERAVLRLVDVLVR